MSIALALLLTLLTALALQAGLPRRERVNVWLGLGMRFVGTAALLALHFKTGSDMDGYGPSGIVIANVVRTDVGHWLPEVLKAVVHADTLLPFQEGATGAMYALSSVVFLIVGDSFIAGCIFVSTLAFFGLGLLYRTCRSYVAPDERQLVAAACFFIPSVAVWTGGLLKEAFAVAGVGILLHATDQLVRRRLLFAVPMVIGAFLVGAVKGYVLFPLALAIGAIGFATRTRIRPLYVIAGLGLAFVGLLALSQLFPEYAIDRVGDSVAQQRYNSLQTEGGSNVELNGSNDERDGSVGQLKYLPLGLLNTLFRPVLFEVRNVSQLGAALEATVVIILVVPLLRPTTMRRLTREVLGSPLLLGSVVFTLGLAAAVGLSSTNLGTISRYRVPMMPMFLMATLILRQRLRVPAVAATRRPLRHAVRVRGIQGHLRRRDHV